MSKIYCFITNKFINISIILYNFREYNGMIIYKGYQKIMRTESKPLSNVQLELLKLYSLDLDEKTLLELKTVMAKFFLEKATTEADKMWLEKNYSPEVIEKLRT